MGDHECLICLGGLTSISFDQDNGKDLCRILQISILPTRSTSSTPSVNFPELFQDATFCPECVRMIQDIGNVFREIERLEQQLSEWRSSIEDKLKHSFEVSEARGQSQVEGESLCGPTFILNNFIRERIFSEIKVKRTDFTGCRNPSLSSIFPTNVVEAEREPESILPNLDFSTDILNTEDPFKCPPSPTTSVGSTGGFFEEEKFVVPSEPESEVILTTSQVEINRSDLKVSSRKSKRKTTTKGYFRTPCPFDSTCKVRINRVHEINEKAHFLRYHKAIRKCYICPDCDKGFYSFDQWNVHQQTHRSTKVLQGDGVTDLIKIEIPSAESLPIAGIQESTNSSQLHSEIVNNPFPILRLRRLRLGTREIQTLGSGSERNEASSIPKSSKPSSSLTSTTFKKSTNVDEKQTGCNTRTPEISSPGKKSSARKPKTRPDRSTRIKCPIKGCFTWFYKTEECRRQAHVRKYHQGIQDCYQCNTCSVAFKLYCQLRKHNEVVHSGEPAFACKFCKEDCKTRVALLVHKKKFHDKLRSKRNYGGYRHQKMQYRWNEAQKEPVPVIKCPIEGCPRTFLVAEEPLRQAHVRRCHEGVKKSFHCEECNIYFKLVHQWKTHRTRVHNAPPAFICKICEETFETEVKLKYHHRLQHAPEKQPHCEICNKTFPSKQKHRDHMRIHTKERPYMCDICSDTFTSPQYLKFHQTLHKDSVHAARAYICQVCERQLSSPAALRKHMKTIHEKSFKLICDQCDYGCQSQSRLDKHILFRHCEERPEICPYCPKRFKEKSTLDMHLRRHRNERPHKCGTCEKAFTSSGALRRHELIHSKAQCHTCEICGKTFPVRNYLYIHMRSHAKDNSGEVKWGWKGSGSGGVNQSSGN